MRILLMFSLLSLLTAPSFAAQTPQVDRIEVVSAGMFKSKVAKKEASPGSATGTREVIASEKLLRQTADIKARLGDEFGFRYRIVGKPKSAKVPVKIVTVFPGEGLRNPKADKPTQRDELNEDRPIGRVLYESYHFDHDWEMVPGVWAFEIWYDGKKLAEQKFTVAKP
ncbi:MAG TPA: DUF3859 domain-containing protein [Pseudolabrys sp.]